MSAVVEPAEIPTVCRDPDDDQVLAAAIMRRVTFIVTGDRDLLDLGSHEGVEIITPATFADRVDPQ